VRPTAEHVRGELLTLLEPDLVNARVLDLCAGTGALGLEAISRGARSVDFVEFRPASLHALRTNVARLHLREATRIFKRDVVPFTAALDPDSYDTWRARGFSRILAVEHARTHELPPGARRRTFGDTAISIYRRAPARQTSRP
jgi:16S rRNA (guanine966-N2)-methyltransferase